MPSRWSTQLMWRPVLHLKPKRLLFDPEGSQAIQNFLNLGPATKAWQLTSLSKRTRSNRASITQSVCSGGVHGGVRLRSTRQAPVVIAKLNRMWFSQVWLLTVTDWLGYKIHDQSALTTERYPPSPVEQFVDRLFLRILSRHPQPHEQAAFVETLSLGLQAGA